MADETVNFSSLLNKKKVEATNKANAINNNLFIKVIFS